MMKYVIVVLFAIFACSLFSEEITFEEKFNAGNKEIASVFMNDKYIAISPLISPRICLGILKAKKLSDDRYFESIFYVHAFDTFSVFKVYGVAYRANAFISDNTRSGVYLLANGGVDYIQYDTGYFCFAGENCNSRIIGRGFVNIAIGFGYSFDLKNDSYLRLEWDLGLKWLGSNIYISYVW
ncbi:MAG: hypothetical protein ISS80_02185 [Candidatus Cloacimonetes bacterium]|nr:hypothetical protein [Candidatus Cloacimonadota bacterium]